MSFFLYIPGDPVAKQRPKFARRGNLVKTFTPAKTVNYETYVKELAAIEMRDKDFEIMTGPLRVAMSFFFSIPKSTTKKELCRIQAGIAKHVKRPDLDNCIKALLDALNGVVFQDDSQIWHISVGKHFCGSEGPHATIEVIGGQKGKDGEG